MKLVPPGRREMDTRVTHIAAAFNSDLTRAVGVGYVQVMGRGRRLVFILVAHLILVLAVIGTVAGLWKWSPLFQEWVYEVELKSGIPSWEEHAAERLLDYPSEASAIALVVYINWAAEHIEIREDEARRALLSLQLMTGEDFGTGFRIYGANYNWDPPSGKGRWIFVRGNVNAWAVRTFGLKALGELALGDGQTEEEESSP